MSKKGLRAKLSVKLITLGFTCVGKTACVRMVEGKSFPESHILTCGVDFGKRVMSVDGQEVKVMLWDTAGQEKFNSISRRYVRGAEGVVLMYDITDEHTFTKISQWLQYLQQNAPNVQMLLFGNKLDCESKRVISTREGQKFADEHNIPFAEVSVKENKSEALKHIRDLVSRVLKARSEVPNEMKRSMRNSSKKNHNKKAYPTIKLDDDFEDKQITSNNNRKKKKGCC